LQLLQGYANRRQKSVNAGILRILENGNLDPIAQPKTYRYANALAGDNWGGAALDMHVGRQVGKQGLLVDPATAEYTTPGDHTTPGVGFPEPSYNATKRIASSPSNTHYPVIEDHLVRQANNLGLTPTQYQALGWVGGAGGTNVADARPLLEILNEKLRTTARQYGYSSPLEAFKAFANGKTPLWAAVPAAALGGGLLSDDGRR
jgi:hypothetical protein